MVLIKQQLKHGTNTTTITEECRNTYKDDTIKPISKSFKNIGATLKVWSSNNVWGGTDKIKKKKKLDLRRQRVYFTVGVARNTNLNR